MIGISITFMAIAYFINRCINSTNASCKL